MRYLVCLVVGLVAGALFAMITANALQRRNQWPRAIMNVMQHELVGARRAARGSSCATTVMKLRRAHLQLLAGDIDGALLGPGGKDHVLTQYSSDLRDAISNWNTDESCIVQDAALAKAADTCDACHRDYR